MQCCQMTAFICTWAATTNSPNSITTTAQRLACSVSCSCTGTLYTCLKQLVQHRFPTGCVAYNLHVQTNQERHAFLRSSTCKQE